MEPGEVPVIGLFVPLAWGLSFLPHASIFKKGEATPSRFAKGSTVQENPPRRAQA
jgi:hypothetical protein